jgi:hypothetical protein
MIAWLSASGGAVVPLAGICAGGGEQSPSLPRVRPAWASTWRWESSRELVTASEVNRRALGREDGVKEAGSEAAGRRTETGYEAAPSRASGLAFAKLL